MFLVLRLLKRVKVCALMQSLRAEITAWEDSYKRSLGEGDTVLLLWGVLVEMGSAEVYASHHLPG